MSHSRESTMTDRQRRTKPPKPTILFRDDHVALVNKPPYVWPREGIFDEPGVFELLAVSTDDAEGAAKQVTSLDYDVSGCVLYAFADSTAGELRKQFVAGRASIQFDCVVNGPLLESSGDIEAEVASPGQDASEYDQLRAAASGTPRTTWRTVDTFVAFARVECAPSIPSDLQVRSHLHHAGIPLAVAARDGGATQLMLSTFKAGYRKSRRHEERPLIRRPSQHANTIAFTHPTTNEPMSFAAEPPKDFRALIHQLDRFGRVPK